MANFKCQWTTLLDLKKKNHFSSCCWCFSVTQQSKTFENIQKHWGNLKKPEVEETGYYVSNECRGAASIFNGNQRQNWHFWGNLQLIANYKTLSSFKWVKRATKLYVCMCVCLWFVSFLVWLYNTCFREHISLKINYKKKM